MGKKKVSVYETGKAPFIRENDGKNLTVRELIEHLKKQPQDAKVYHLYDNSYNFMDDQWNPPVEYVRRNKKGVFLIGGSG
jgi:hypothetical protein